MQYIITGPNQPNGNIRVSGAKNFAIKAMAASLLVPNIHTYENLPTHSDVDNTITLLESIGVNVNFNKLTKKCIVDSRNFSNDLSNAKISSMGVFLFAAALIHHFNEVKIPKQKGCSLGQRLDNFHKTIFAGFGIEIIDYETYYYLRKSQNLIGNIVELPYPSVGATETALFLSVAAHGITTISNAAIEPEIQALITMLTSMGARIFFESDRVIKVHGTQHLQASQKNYIHGDLLEAATWATLAFATNSKITVSGFVPEMMGSFLGLFNMLEGKIERTDNDALAFYRKDNFTPQQLNIETGVFPSLRTDLQPFIATMGSFHKSMQLHETVFDDRLEYIQSFKNFGIKEISGHTECFGKKCRFKNKSTHSLQLNGVSSLHSNNNIITAQTIRGGMAQIIMAIAAHGTTTIKEAQIVERGYCSLFEKLQSLNIGIARATEFQL